MELNHEVGWFVMPTHKIGQSFAIIVQRTIEEGGLHPFHWDPVCCLVFVLACLLDIHLKKNFF